MKLTILKNYLTESIQHVSKAISSKTTIPILTGIKIDAATSGVTLTASDTDISIQSFTPNENEEIAIIELHQPGSVVLPAKFFMEIIRKLPSQKIEIEVRDHFQTIIRSGSSEIQIMGLDPEEYPLLPQLEESKMIQIPSDLLKTMIKQTSFAVSTNETTPILTGVLWHVQDGKLKFIACDRHRLASREISLDLDVAQTFHNIVISGRTLNELSKILPDQNALIDILVSDNQVLFKINSILFYSRILDGTYPDTSKLIPQSFQTELIVNTKELADAIDRAYLLSREDKTNIVKLIMLEDETIEISSSSSELGKVTEQLSLQSFKGERLRISFNSKYMLDALKVMDSDYIQIGFTGAMQPIIIKPEDQANILQLILPYRTTN
ncbi:DNA polymerase III subunit beta [Paenibacillus larvae]|uniref:DNA polymerase III subunit beta n=1 Tax=Paenibacillus larvae TaxID=1464 RepID=UPI00016938E8|nr:DNA polymerase III subunit beta [Paenibacillus larvae]AQR78700.1 DNA polymerase III subunit beta [Paenibacillus larvae subsp. larvae]AVF20022.1 DNA polymerase III subunit beta [Paenibacillus larvae subsp. larvae]ETK29112.1 DNA polymerase III subunit beta [Paenibacillus larvae subsp. larvae DSM 25719]MCY7475227.1 DNA polymerase III subunit beta [Paenibacillus larvae]MCY7488410.1 DNA polymerase III subunit beta [Paenibacillus larvae]